MRIPGPPPGAAWGRKRAAGLKGVDLSGASPAGRHRGERELQRAAQSEGVPARSPSPSPGPAPAATAHPQAAPSSRCQATALMAAPVARPERSPQGTTGARRTDGAARRGALWAARQSHGGAQAASGALGSVVLYRCRASAVAAFRGDVSAEASPHHAAPQERGGRDGGPHGAGRGGRRGCADRKMASSGLEGRAPYGAGSLRRYRGLAAAASPGGVTGRGLGGADGPV